jgi:hypothetical protein
VFVQIVIEVLSYSLIQGGMIHVNCSKARESSHVSKAYVPPNCLW